MTLSSYALGETGALNPPWVAKPVIFAPGFEGLPFFLSLVNGPPKTGLLAARALVVTKEEMGDVMDPRTLTGLLNAVCDLKPLRFQVKREPVYYSSQIIGAIDFI